MWIEQLEIKDASIEDKLLEHDAVYKEDKMQLLAMSPVRSQAALAVDISHDELPVKAPTQKSYHEMKRSFPWEEAVVTISLDDSSDSDCEKDKHDRAKRDKKDCSTENLEDITSEGTLIRMAGMYQDYMKPIPIPTFSGSVVPFTSWQGLAQSLKQLYKQPLHYLTNTLLKQWDRERVGSDNERQPLDAVVHPVKAQTLIWLTEEVHRLTASPYHLAKLWASDPMYHSQIDPSLSN